MSVLRLQPGLPMLGQQHFVNDGRGGGGGTDATIVNQDQMGTGVSAVGKDVVAHPLDSIHIDEVLDFFRRLPSAMPRYSSRNLVELSKRLVRVATRTPWTKYPQLSGEPGYAERWQNKIPPLAAMNFSKAIRAASEQASIVEVARFLEAQCDEIYNRKALLVMFGSCILTLPQGERAPTIKALLSGMMRRSDLCDAEKLPDRLNPIIGAMQGLPRKQFMEIYQGLSVIEREVSASDPSSRIGEHFVRGICDLYFTE